MHATKTSNNPAWLRALHTFYHFLSQWLQKDAFPNIFPEVDSAGYLLNEDKKRYLISPDNLRLGPPVLRQFRWCHWNLFSKPLLLLLEGLYAIFVVHNSNLIQYKLSFDTQNKKKFMQSSCCQRPQFVKYLSLSNWLQTQIWRAK